ESPAAHHAAAVVLHHHVGRRAESERELPPARRREIEADALLAARLEVEGPGTVRRVGLHREATEEVQVPAGLDLDHLGAELGEEPADLGADRAHAEVDDPASGEDGIASAAACRVRAALREARAIVRARGR